MFSATTQIHALLGGTFDPIHYGHLKPVEALAQQIGLQQVILVPNNVPPHRPQPNASAEQRLAMLKLAIIDRPLFSIDPRELQKSSPSYTIETLIQLRAEQGSNVPLAFIIGQDSLLTLHLWHRWQEILDYCHLLVCARPSYSRSLSTPELQHWMSKHKTDQPVELQRTSHGLIYLADTPLLTISATEIRQRLHHQQTCDALLPNAVQHYIHAQGLYR